MQVLRGGAFTVAGTSEDDVQCTCTPTALATRAIYLTAVDQSPHSGGLDNCTVERKEGLIRRGCVRRRTTRRRVDHDVLLCSVGEGPLNLDASGQGLHTAAHSPKPCNSCRIPSLRLTAWSAHAAHLVPQRILAWMRSTLRLF